jgi:hypothetical protein
MLLTITIPTFNRLSKLKKQIASITYQIKKLKLQKKVQILVGENTNLSNQIISNNYLSRFKKINLKIIRNNQNIGYAKNLNNLILNSQGRFTWLLSDDDILQPNALISIVSAIKKNNNVDYYTFRSFTGGSKKKNTKQDLYFFDLPKTNKDNYVFMDGKEFLKKYWISVIFISINVFNTQKMKTHLKKNKYLENINDVYHNSYLCIPFIKNIRVCIILDSLLTDSYANKYYDLENKYEVNVVSWIKLVEDLYRFKLPITTIIEMRFRSLGKLKYIFKYLILYLFKFQNYNEILFLLKKKKSFFIIESFLIILFSMYIKISKYININKVIVNLFSSTFEKEIQIIINNKLRNENLKKKGINLTYNKS